MSLAPRFVSTEKRGEDADQTLRPQSLKGVIGRFGRSMAQRR